MSDEQSIRDDIRSAYVRPVGIFGGYGAEHRAELFDAWERRIQAEAWDRCVGEMPIDLDWKNFYGDNNPYREQNSEGEANV